MSWLEDGLTIQRCPKSFLPDPEECHVVPADTHADIVIIGAGRAGLHIAKSLGDVGRTVIFDAEPWAPYDRVMLSNLLSREVEEEHIFFDMTGLAHGRNLHFVRQQIVKIDRRAKFVQSADQRRTYYQKLVLCLGSSARRPPIPGIELEGVYTFRDLDDSHRLIERARHARHAVIIGGGYLGLETASGLSRRGLQCAVVEMQDRLMPDQLEPAAASQLKAIFERQDVSVHTERQVLSIEGNASREVAAVRLDDDEMLKAEMVVVCAGVTPNVGLAREAGLDVGHGIIVNDSMVASDPSIYAVGECAEHRGRVYGLVGPVIEQAEVALEALRGGTPSYSGSVTASSLKVAGIELFVAGTLQCRNDGQTQIIDYHDRSSGTYRALAIRGKRIVGGVTIGSSGQICRLRRAIEAGEAIRNRQARRFARTGQLWSDDAGFSVADWPGETLVCHCRLVTKGTIDAAITSGAGTGDAVSYSTGAGQLCGSCKPLIDELLGQGSEAEQGLSFGVLGIVSFIVLACLAAFLIAPPWPVSSEISTSFRVETLWTDSILKQVTGFSLVGCVVVASLLFLRKRVSRGLPGSYKSWRLVHAGLGVLMIALLFTHTGFRVGHNMNGWLMATFLATLSVGTFAGVAAALNRGVALALPGSTLTLKRLTAWLHILIAWPLPLLLFMHILMIYYF